jgi:hypothetical protein
MTQQLANDRQAESACGTEARVGVPQIVQANTFNCAPRHRLPRSFQISARLLGIVARHNVRAYPVETG